MASSKGLPALPFLLLLPVLLLIHAQPSHAEAVVDAASYDAGKNSLPGQAEPGAAMAPVNQEGGAGVKAVKTPTPHLEGADIAKAKPADKAPLPPQPPVQTPVQNVEEEPYLDTEQPEIDYETGKVIADNNGNRTLISPLLQKPPATEEEAEKRSLADPAIYHEDVRFTVDMTVFLMMATFGAFTAVVLGAPLFVGFMLGGMIVGPSGLDLIKHTAHIESLASAGAGLLLFVQGLTFHDSSIVKYRTSVCITLVVQALAIALAFVVLVWHLTLDLPTFKETLILVFCVSNASSHVALKMAHDQKHHDTLYYELLDAMVVAQDLAMGVFLCIPNALMSGLWGVMVLLRELVVLLLLVSFSVYLAVQVMPRLTHLFVREENPQLFVLSLFTLCMTVASFTRGLGLSTEFGAFFAGLMMSKTAYVKDALNRVDSVKDIFAAMLFASFGMIISPMFVLNHMVSIIALFVVMAVVKFFSAVTPLVMLGYPPVSAAMASMCAAQYGEFSLIVAGKSFSLGLITRQSYLLCLSVSLASLLITPMLFSFLLRVMSLDPPRRSRKIISMSAKQHSDDDNALL